MQDMTTFAHPIELSNDELDLVAAGWAQQKSDCGCRSGGNGNNVAQFGLINLNDVASNNNVNILGIQAV